VSTVRPSGAEDEAILLAFRAGLPYVGLRDCERERDTPVSRIVPARAARAARVLPLHADEERIRLAVADPGADLSALAPHVGARRVELVIAPADELDALLGPPDREPDLPAPIVAEPAPDPKPDLEPVVPAPPPTPPPRRRRRVLLVVLVALLAAAAVVALVLLLAAS
jgi:hypothetical protein